MRSTCSTPTVTSSSCRPIRIPTRRPDWIASLDALAEDVGRERAQFVLYKLLKRARQLHIGLPPLTQTRYINTISPEQEAAFPGDEDMERRIRRLVRWNAVAMVLRANKASPGIGGHLATYASATSLYEVGLQPLLPRQGRRWHGRPGLLPGSRRARHVRARLPRGPPDASRSSTTSAARSCLARACRPTRTRA